MLLAIARRVLTGAFVTVFVVTVVFVAMRAMGSPGVLYLGDEATAEQVAEFNAVHGLAEPIWEQWVDFGVGVAHGDWGESYKFAPESAMDVVMSRAPASAILVGLAILCTVLIGVPIGAYAGLRPGGAVDAASRGVAVVGSSAPSFWVGILLIVVFAVHLHWLPAVGIGTWKSLVLPVATLALFNVPSVMRVARSAVLEVMGRDFIRAVRAKGVSERRVVLRHALPNAAIPIITIIGLRVAFLIGGTIVVEQVFAYPGIGSLAIDSLEGLDFPVVQAFIVLVAGTIVGINVVVDILYQLTDPRIRVS